MSSPWFTVKELAERWKKSSDSIEHMLRKKKLLGRKIGGTWRVHATVVEEYEAPAIPRHQETVAKLRARPQVAGLRRRAICSEGVPDVLGKRMRPRQ